MFAFAIWDNEKFCFVHATDLAKSLFITITHINHDEFVFASEMKAFWAAGIHKKMDNEMLLNYLTLGWVQNPVNKQQTFFEDIFSLPPSHYLIYQFRQTMNLILK